MYFWKIDSLTQELKSGSLSQSERAYYLIATVTVYAFVLEFSFLFAASINTLQVVQSALIIAITIAGTMYCYLVNRSGDDREFVDRFVCIGWVVSVRVTVLFGGALLLYLIVGHAIGGEAFDRFTESNSWVDLVYTLVISGILYWLMGKHIKKVAS